MANILPLSSPMKNYLIPFTIFWCCACQPKVAPPEPLFPIPSERQIAWQELEYYGFIHFNMNTFSDREWGFGDEQPEQFNPTELDARQWARVASEAGMKGLIITAKHHDGFVLWPSAYTEHSVKNSPWRDGKGDLIREFVDACREFDLKVGIYYSPWDRNHPDYGMPEYITYMRNQLTELLTNYGDVFEVWFDGANGGDGWYGGANETRKVDKFSYYDWPTTHALVRELQPNAMMFSDAGPDVRWVGNEHGYAYETTWSNLYRDSVYAGMPEYSEKWADGQENGSHWVPAESDVSIRPGWYYHAYEDHKVKTLDQLVEIYYRSIGRNSSILINFPVDRRGLIHEKDEAAILALGQKIRADFEFNLLGESEVTASDERGKDYTAEHVIDADYESYWTVSDGVAEASLTFDFGTEVRFNRLLLQEYTPLGQRVKSFVLEKETPAGWERIAEGTTIGYKRIMRFSDQTAQRVRIRFLDGKDIPVISEAGLYRAKPLLLAPKYDRKQSGELVLLTADSGLEIKYSIDGTEPSLKYDAPLNLQKAVTLRAVAVDEKSGQKSEELRLDLEQSKLRWIVPIKASVHAIDEDATTFYTSEDDELLVDLGELLLLKGFSYLPMQARYPSGFIQNFEFQVSVDAQNWETVSQGEFSNIANNPIQQEIRFDPVSARYIRLIATKTSDGNTSTFAELGVLTK